MLHYLKLFYSSGINKSGELCSNRVISEEHTRRGRSQAATVTCALVHKTLKEALRMRTRHIKDQHSSSVPLVHFC